MQTATIQAKNPAIAPAVSGVPEWVSETPEHQTMEYVLQLENGDGTALEYVHLSRPEYLWLKAHLSVLREHMTIEQAREMLNADASNYDRLGPAIPFPLGSDDETEDEKITARSEHFKFGLPLTEARGAHIQKLEAANLALSHGDGCSRPAEDFIHSILMRYGIHGTLKPGDIEDLGKEFQENYALMRGDTAFFLANNPELVAELTSKSAA